jgi:tRNA(adenine34) deaminase
LLLKLLTTDDSRLTVNIAYWPSFQYTFPMRDEDYIEVCLAEARAAWAEDEVPVGAVIIDEKGDVIAAAHNMTRSLNNPAAHAEMLAIGRAAEALGNYRLTECTLFVTMEPCLMCAGAIIEARLKRLVFGCYDEKRGAFGSVIDANLLPLNHKVAITGGVLNEDCAKLLKDFFSSRRGTEVAITGATRNRLYV